MCAAQAVADSGVDRNAASKRLHALFEAEWEWTMREFPTWASRLGDRRYNRRWPDVSLEAYRRRHEHRKAVLKRLEEFDPDELPEQDRISLQLFRQSYRYDVEEFPFGWYLLPLNQRGGIQTAHELADALRFETIADFEDWIVRLQRLPEYIAQTTELMREGVRTGRTHPRRIMQRVVRQIEAQCVNDPRQSPFYKPFHAMPASISDQAAARLRKRAETVIADRVVPAFRTFLRFFREEYLPACLERPGIWQFPQGERHYRVRARRFTTTELTPQQIHDLGWSEIRRIRAEMERVVERSGFDGDVDAYIRWLRTDRRFYFQDPRELLREYRAVAKRIDPELVRLFGTLPRTPYGVVPIPELIAPDTTTAYYQPPAADGSRAGLYFVNLYKPETRPRYEIEVLTLHEAVPGHHLQIALAMELKDLPKFRRYQGFTAFVEGWALYAESLGDRLGLYQDPPSQMGRLSYEMWRAVRLVVDTGIHAFRWSRQQAIDVFLKYTAKTRLDIENEVDRYITWPGQALAYKVGEITIQRLRSQAEKRLGDRFDIREFHDVVLRNGAVTLGVLQEQVERWIARKTAATEQER
ncbi:MAG: DUF885 domain-containing protein [Planctomycetota bacterium]|nr:MAG: DUF885 domain-containing protein [Planctomycetota bacterium]